MTDRLENGEMTGVISNGRHDAIRWRAGRESGDMFEEGVDYDGFTLTVEISGADDARAMLRAIENIGSDDVANEGLIRCLAYGLDACLDHLNAAAAREKRREEGKALRSVTEQQRAEMASKAVAEAFGLLGLEP